MNPDSDDELEKLVNSIMQNGGFKVFLDDLAEASIASYTSMADEDLWAKENLINVGIRALPPAAKFEFGDVVITRAGKTGTVEETFYDEDCEFNIVVFTNSDTYKESELSLVCSAI